MKAFGKRLAAFLKRQEVIRILTDADLEGWGYGGCWILAAALFRLTKWVGAEMYYVGSSAGVEHVVVRIGDVFLDDAGAHSEREIVAKIKADDKFLAPFDEDAQAVASGAGTTCDFLAVDKLTRALEQEFGAFPVRVDSLPDDLQQLLLDFSSDSGWLEKHPKIEAEFGSVVLPVLVVPVRDLPVIRAVSDSGDARQWDKLLPVEDLPPLVVAHGRLIDGRHRLWAARQQGLPTVRAIDASEIIERRGMSRVDDLGPVKKRK